MLNFYLSATHSMSNFAVRDGESRHESIAKQRKQPCSCQTSLKTLLFHLVQRISLHLKTPDLHLFCTTKDFPTSQLPFESQARFQCEEFGSYECAPRSLSLVACSLSSLSAHAYTKKTPVSKEIKSNCYSFFFFVVVVVFFN